MVILPALQPVGYHAWLDGDRLALFVLGNPATLRIGSLTTGKAATVAREIGRSLHRVPGRTTVSFVQWDSDGKGAITELDPESGQTKDLAPLLDGNEFYAWTPDGVLLMGQGSRLFRFLPGISQGWEEVADLAPAGVRGISRIAVSPEGRRVAVVANEG